jgi:hypothetical protein
VTNVETANAAPQPPIVVSLAGRVPRKRRFDPRNEAYLRQGEWSFVPVSDLRVAPWQIRRNEPLARAGRTPHVCASPAGTARRPSTCAVAGW